MHTLFKVERRHDDEVDGAPQVDEVCLGAVLDLDLLLRGSNWIFLALILFIFLVFPVASLAVLAKNLGLDLTVLFFVGLKVGVYFEDVEALLNL